MEHILYGQKTDVPMPGSFLTSHSVWDDFISDIWTVVLKDYTHLKTSHILEIGPGVSTKIGGALARLRFCGALYVVDPQPEVLTVLKGKYQKILPNADIRYISKPFKEALDTLPEKPDVILGNHVLDDMMIYESETAALEWSVNYTHQPSNDLKHAWQCLSDDHETLKSVKKRVINNVTNVYQTLNPQLMILNQYPSATLHDHDMRSLNEHAGQILKTLKRKISNVDIQNILNTCPNYNNPHIGNNILNGENWMICTKK